MIPTELFKSYNVYTTNTKLNAVYKPYKNLVLYSIDQKTYYCKQQIRKTHSCQEWSDSP